MSMHTNTIKSIMKKATSRPVSEKAIYLMVFESEKWINKIVENAEKLLEQRNKQRKNQGLKTKSKISHELIQKILDIEGDENV